MTVVSCNFWQIPPNWFESALAIQSCLPACRPFRLSQRVGACTSAGRRYSGAQFSFGSFSRININYERAGSRKAGLLQEKRTTTLHNVRNSPSSGSIHKSLNHHIIHFQLRVQQLPYQTRFLCPAAIWRDERVSWFVLLGEAPRSSSETCRSSRRRWAQLLLRTNQPSPGLLFHS